MTVLPPIDWPRVGHAVRQARSIEGETLRAFARRLCVDFRTLHNLEREKPVKATNYLRIAAGLKRDPYELGGMSPPNTGAD